MDQTNFIVLCCNVKKNEQVLWSINSKNSAIDYKTEVSFP